MNNVGKIIEYMKGNDIVYAVYVRKDNGELGWEKVREDWGAEDYKEMMDQLGLWLEFKYIDAAYLMTHKELSAISWREINSADAEGKSAMLESNSHKKITSNDLGEYWRW